MADTQTAVAEPEPGETLNTLLEDEYVGDPPGDEEVSETKPGPSGEDAGEEANAAEETKEPATASAPEGEDEATASAEEPAFSEALVEQAKRLGYENPESFGTEENLQSAVDQFNRQMASLGQSATSAAPAVAAASVPAPVVPVHVTPAHAVAPAEIAELKEFGDELEPEVREPLNRLVQRHRAVELQQQGRLDALQKTVDDLQAQGEQQARLAISNHVDNFIATLPDGYAEHLGKGTRSQLGANSAFVNVRAEIDEQIQILIAGYGVAGRDLPPDGELILAATRNVLGSKNDSIIQKQAAAQADKRQSQATARPAGQKTSRKPTQKQEAKEAIDKAWAATGLPDGDDEDEVF